MKKILLSIPLIAFAVFSKAQITLDVTDFASVNDTVFMGIDNQPPTGLNMGTTGGPQIWDFSTLQTRALDTLLFQNPASTIHGASFPTSNISYLNNGLYVYLNKSASAVQAVGTAGNFGTVSLVAPFTPPYNVITFPTSLGTSYNDTYNFDQIISVGVDTTVNLLGTNYQVILDSIRVKRRSNIDVNFDAFGTMNTVFGTQNVLRSKLIQNTTDTTYLYMGQALTIPLVASLNQGWNLVTPTLAAALSTLLNINISTGNTITTSFDFYAKNNKFRYASITVDNTTLAPTRAEFISRPDLLVGIESHTAVMPVNFFPNPATDFINVQLEQNSTDLLEIFDVNGKIVLTHKLANGSQINIQNLAKGVYTLQLKDNNKNIKGVSKLIK
jgi:hypothetical protein